MSSPTALRFVIALAAGLAAAAPLLASPITSANDPALAGATVYGFSDMPVGSTEYSTLAIPGAGQISDGGAADMYLQQAATLLSSPVLYTGSAPLIRFDFAYDLAAFGFEWFAIDNSVRMDAYNAAGLLLESLDIVDPDQNATHFSGVADTGIRSVVLTPLDSFGHQGLDNYLIDDLSYVAAPPSNPNAVPEPATPALTITALAGAALTARRRRAAR